MVIWVIGMSGAGKTTIGKNIYKQVKKEYSNTVFIDGDEIRKIFKHENIDNDYTMEDRKKNANRITELCKWLDNQDIHVVCCILSIFGEERKLNRDYFSDYYEIYVHAPIEFLVKNRDYRGIYKKAQKGLIRNVVGIDIPFSEPESPDVIIDNTIEREDFSQLTDGIVSKCLAKIRNKYNVGL